MPFNVEIKAALKDRQAALARAALLADSGPEIIHREDVFFRCEGARLKLPAPCSLLHPISIQVRIDLPHHCLDIERYAHEHRHFFGYRLRLP